MQTRFHTAADLVEFQTQGVFWSFLGANYKGLQESLSMSMKARPPSTFRDVLIRGWKSLGLIAFGVYAAFEGCVFLV